MNPRFVGLNIFFFDDITLSCKLVYTTNYVILFSNLGIFFFRFIDIRLYVSYGVGVFVVFYSNKANIGLRTLLKSAILQCCFGCYRYLFLSGIGFRILLENSCVFFRLGYANLISIVPPVGVFFLYIDKFKFCLYSINLVLLTKFCNYLRLLHLNNVYKQRGLYFSNEILKFKILRNKKVYI